MAVLNQPSPAQLLQLAVDLGINPEHVQMSSISSEYNSGDKDVVVSWECIKRVSIEEFNIAMRNLYGP